MCRWRLTVALTLGGLAAARLLERPAGQRADLLVLRDVLDAVGAGDRLGGLDPRRGRAALGDPARRPGAALGRARAGGGRPDRGRPVAGPGARHPTAPRLL